ncbi:MAG: transposase [Planctomycetaceae bacterium]|nr:transposase [Planctomycetaceae bacterium]
MVSIHRFPPFGKRFFKRIRKILGCTHFAHLWRIVIGLASIPGKKSLSKFTRLYGKRRTRQAISHFLTESEWDAPELLLENAHSMLRRLGYKAGATVYLIVDDTQKQKRAKQMDAVSKIFLHAEKVYANGHTILGLAFVYRGVVVPCAVRLWASKDYCEKSQKSNNKHEEVEFKKLPQLGAEAIESITLPSKGKVIVLFDKFYLCNTITKACENKGFTYIGAVKDNRNFYPDGRPNDKKKVGAYAKNVLDRDSKTVSISGSRKAHCVAERVGDMKKLGRVKLAFSRRRGETSRLVVATNGLKWGAKNLIEHYRHRWPIEILFKMSKQHLGLGDYQFLRYTAVVRYLHLVMISHHLLTHLATDRHGAKELRNGCGVLRLASIEQMQGVLRNMLFEDQVKSISTGTKYEGIAKKLKAILMPVE